MSAAHSSQSPYVNFASECRLTSLELLPRALEALVGGFFNRHVRLGISDATGGDQDRPLWNNGNQGSAGALRLLLVRSRGTGVIASPFSTNPFKPCGRNQKIAAE
jgi:hypothetical protein